VAQGACYLLDNLLWRGVRAPEEGGPYDNWCLATLDGTRLLKITLEKRS